jgi:hypothetical protein
MLPFSYPEPFLRAVNGARRGALAKSISNWHLMGYNEGYCSNTWYILLPCFHGIRLWILPEPLVAPRVRRALGTRMLCFNHVIICFYLLWFVCLLNSLFVYQFVWTIQKVQLAIRPIKKYFCFSSPPAPENLAAQKFFLNIILGFCREPSENNRIPS